MKDPEATIDGRITARTEEWGNFNPLIMLSRRQSRKSMSSLKIGRSISHPDHFVRTPRRKTIISTADTTESRVTISMTIGIWRMRSRYSSEMVRCKNTRLTEDQNRGNAQPTREIHTIYGGPHRGGSSRRTMKEYAREAERPKQSLPAHLISAVYHTHTKLSGWIVWYCRFLGPKQKQINYFWGCAGSVKFGFVSYKIRLSILTSWYYKLFDPYIIRQVLQCQCLIIKLPWYNCYTIYYINQMEILCIKII